MDIPPEKSRRSSILKLRQSDVTVDNTFVDDDQKQVTKRRVSFHNVKTVQNFGKDNLNLLDGSPFKEKIQETMGSDGVLTPGKSHITSSTPSATYGHNDVENATFVDNTIIDGDVSKLRRHEKTNYFSSDMSLDYGTCFQVDGCISRADASSGTENDTLMILNTQPGQHMPVLSTPLYSQIFTNKNAANVSSAQSEHIESDDTMGIFENACEVVEIYDDNETRVTSEIKSENKFGASMEPLSTSDPDIDLNPANVQEDSVTDLDNIVFIGRRTDASYSKVINETVNLLTTDDNVVVLPRSENSVIASPRLGCDEDSDNMEWRETTENGFSCAESLEEMRADISLYPKECTPMHEQLLQSKVDNNDVIAAKNGTALDSNIAQTLNEDVADLRTISMENVTEMNNESRNEVNITRRDISLMQIGSRFRASTSSKDDTVLSLQSLVDESACFRKTRMMFDSQSLQVNYVTPANDQPESNLIREQLLEELRRKILEIKENSSSKVAMFLPKLQVICPAKVTAIRNMDIRTLQLDDIELLYCGRLRAEIEWAQIRFKVAQEARSALEHRIANDELVLRACREDAQLCCSTDQLQSDVQALQAELAGLPFVDEIVEIIASHKKCVKDEANLDCRIHDLEIEELLLEFELVKAKNKELNETITELDDLAKKFDRNKARVRGFTRQILNSYK